MHIRALDLLPQWVSDNLWETITGTITATAGAAVAYLKRRLDQMVEHKMDTEKCPVLVDASWDNAVAALEMVQDLRHILSAVRVVLLVTENGNGIPLDKSVKASIILESFADWEQAAKPFWQDRPTDSAYSKLVNEVYSTGQAVVMTEQLPDCDLKQMYRQGGIVSSFIVKVHHSSTRFFYLSCPLSNNGADKYQNQEEVKRVAREIGTMFEDNPQLAKYIRNRK